jgi:hypothetical protein
LVKMLSTFPVSVTAHSHQEIPPKRFTTGICGERKTHPGCLRDPRNTQKTASAKTRNLRRSGLRAKIDFFLESS